MRIKCPKCNKIIILLVWQDTDNYSTEQIKEYECKCGCHFEVTFKIKNIKILDKNY